MDSKVLLLAVIVALVGIAFYMRTRFHRPHAEITTPAPTTATAPSAKPARPR